MSRTPAGRGRRVSRTAGLCLAAALLAVAAEGSQPVVGVGANAPAFQGLRLDGSVFDSAELAGSFVLLDFWGTWCPPCIVAFPKLSRLHDHHAHRGFQVLGLAVLSGTPDEVAEFLEDYDVTYPIVVVERDVPDLYRVLSFPTYILVAPSGEILRIYQGQPGDLYELFSEDLERLMPAAVDTPDPPG